MKGVSREGNPFFEGGSLKAEGGIKTIDFRFSPLLRISYFLFGILKK